MPIGKAEEKFPDSVNMESEHPDGVQRVLAKLEATLGAGNYYEAHQMYKSLYPRYVRQKKYAELLDLLYQGADRLLQHEQYLSGIDVAKMYVTILKLAGRDPTETYFVKISHLFNLMTPSLERDAFLKHALWWSRHIDGRIRWSIHDRGYETGHPDLQKRIAHIFWKEKNYCAAKEHFLHSTDGTGCALMLIEFHKQYGYSNELDLFIAQVVLQYLCLRNKAAAQEAFNSYTGEHPRICSGPPYFLPLLNFLFFLLKTIDTGKLELFTVLCEQYRMALSRDTNCIDHLDKIRSLFFNAPPLRPDSDSESDTEEEVD